MEDLIELIDVISALEEWPPAEQFCKDAAYRPYINCRKLENIP
jgi:hypothetical protein